MVMLNVQFSDGGNTVIKGYFSSPQDPAEYPNQEVIDSSDARYKSFYDALSSSRKRGMPVPDSEITPT